MTSSVVRTVATPVLALSIASASCAVIPHPAHVRHGNFVAVTAGAARVTGTSDDGEGTVTDTVDTGGFAQLAFGHGYRRTLLYVAVPLLHPMASSDRAAVPLSTSVGIYRQLGPLDRPAAWGVGALLGASPEVYVMAGHRHRGGSVNGGARLCVSPSWCVHGFGSAQLGQAGALTIGAWLDAWKGNVNANPRADKGSERAELGILGGLQLGLQ